MKACDVPSCHLPQQAPSPQLRGISMAWSWHSTTRTRTQPSRGEREGCFFFFFFFFFFFEGGWVCSWAGGHPQSSRTYNGKLARHSRPLRRSGVPLDNAVSLGWTAGVGERMQAWSDGTRWRDAEKQTLAAYFEVDVRRGERHQNVSAWWTGVRGGERVCTYGTVHVSWSWRTGGEGVCVLVLRCHWAIRLPSCVCERVLYMQLCTPGLTVYRKSKAGGNRLALRSGGEAHTLWCVLSLQWRSFLQQGAKGEDSRGELAPFPLRGLEMVSFVRQPCPLPPGPPSFLMCVLVFNTVRLQLSNQTKVNLCSQAWMSVQLLKVYSLTLYMRQIITSTSWDVMETSLISCAAYQYPPVALKNKGFNQV